MEQSDEKQEAKIEQQLEEDIQDALAAPRDAKQDKAIAGKGVPTPLTIGSIPRPVSLSLLTMVQFEPYNEFCFTWQMSSAKRDSDQIFSGLTIRMSAQESRACC